MGLSSSQARLLTLTSRMHDIEYKAAKLEAQKLQMANESRKAYDDYLVALDATKIQMKTINTDGSLNYVDATYNNLTSAGYIIEFEGLQGRAIPDSDYAKIVEFYNIAAPNRDYFIALYTNRVTPTNNQAPDGVYEIYTTDQLKALTNNNSYRLMCDISLDSTFNDLSNITIDGNGHTITVTTGNSLFNSLSHSNISNLKVVNNNNTDTSIFANEIKDESKITNVSVSGTIYNPTASNVGGFAQSIASGSKIYNCESDVNITALSHAGGFAYIIAGHAEINNCISNGSVNAAKFAGGFVVQFYHAKISNTISNTDVTINHDVNESLDSGGFAATCANGAIFENCTSNGSVTNTSNITLADGITSTHTIGGFVGATGSGNIKFTNCDSNSKVTSNQDYIAGFISCINPDGNIEITNCHANSSLTTGGTQGGKPAIGGFINGAASGSSTITLTDCSSAYSGDFIKVIGDAITETGTDTGVKKSCNNTAAGASLTNNKKLDSSEEVAAGVLYDEYIAGHLYKESEADKYCLSTHKDDTQWLTNMVNSGFLFIFKNDKKGEKYQISVAVDTGLQEVSDEKDLRKAEAKYEADMKKIDMKDRRYDTELAALDNERNAIKSEMETLKTVAKDNVERTFKLFS